MGLDMYLEARVSAYRPFREMGEGVEPKRKVLEDAATAVGLPKSDNIDFITITRECAYWRKANAIHAWFVRTVQDGTDDCGHYYVSREQLAELRDLCAGLLVNKDADEALAKLPPQEGFFFGSTEINDYFWSDLQDTVDQIDKVLATVGEDAEFYYHSSW